jgi:5-formyltetrahydrofolate cyclo-ligase
MTKAELRTIYLDKLKAILPEERAEKSKFIAEQFFTNFDLTNINLLHCFIPIEKFNEVDTSFIFNRIWNDFPHVHTVVPRACFRTGEMESLRFTSETELKQNAWQIHEPVHDEAVEIAEIDMVVVPGLCFDSELHRVGYGKGFYDRFLSKCRVDCVKIGLSYFPPVEAITEVGEHDIRLDFCVTPERIFSA